MSWAAPPAVPLSTDDLGMFFAPAHHAWAETLRGHAAALGASEETGDAAAVRALAEAGILRAVVGEAAGVDARSLCLARELLGFVSPRADSIAAVQGLGTRPIGLAGHAAHRAQLGAFAEGTQVAAFALTEPGAGSDVAAIATRAVRDGAGWRLDGEKWFISNAPIASHATVFATVDPSLGARGLCAFWVPLDAPGVRVVETPPMAPHPLGQLHLEGVTLGDDARIGEVGDGMKLAMRTLDTFRVSVGAAALGMAERALAEALAHLRSRVQFGKPLIEQPLLQAMLADLRVALDGARLLVYRAAWLKDTTGQACTVEVSMAKLAATEAASRVIDGAVQLVGGRACLAGHLLEHLARAVRPLRIYEGTSEIQRTIIGRAMAKADRGDQAKRGMP